MSHAYNTQFCLHRYYLLIILLTYRHHCLCTYSFVLQSCTGHNHQFKPLGTTKFRLDWAWEMWAKSELSGNRITWDLTAWIHKTSVDFISSWDLWLYWVQFDSCDLAHVFVFFLIYFIKVFSEGDVVSNLNLNQCRKTVNIFSITLFDYVLDR